MTDDFEKSIEYGIVAVLVAIAFIFIGICMLVFCLSRSATKKFLRETTENNYRSANSLFIASIMFTVFIGLFTFGGIAGFFTCLVEIWQEQDAAYVIWDIVEIVEFLFAATAFTLGICAITAFGKARSLHFRLYGVQTYQQYYPPVYQQNTQQYPGQSSYPAGQPPAEKMCPGCGVVNDGKNQFCVFCGRAL